MKQFEINVFAPITLIQTLLPLLQKGKQPHVVNIGSMGGFQGSTKFKGLSAYSSSKAALACYTECLAEELRDSHISFNCLALGTVQTDMLNQAFPGYKANLSPEEAGKYIADFALTGQKFFNGKVIPVNTSTP